MHAPIKTNRRVFLQGTAGSALAMSSPASSTLPMTPAPANDRIGIATIGLGQQGTSVTRAALGIAGVQLVGIADLYQGRRSRAKEIFGPDIVATNDYRELLDRDDIDAVIVATSDHWHARICIDAMRAGKDVYCEKPMVHQLDEGHRMIAAERETGQILQVGSQRTSSELYREARRLIREGTIGRLVLVEAWYHRSSTNGAWQYVVPPDASLRTVDWKRFLGDAPHRPFDAMRFFRWRNYWDYGTAIPGDLFVHLLTGLHFIVDSEGPEKVLANGGLRFWRDDREVPDLMMGLYQYPETESHSAFDLQLKVNFADLRNDSGFRFVGSEGIMTLGRSEIELTRRARVDDIRPSISTFPAALQEELLAGHTARLPRPPVREAETRTVFSLEPTSSGNQKHFEAFLEGVRTRKPVLQNSVFGFRAAGPALLANTSYLEGRLCRWDPRRMAESSA